MVRTLLAGVMAASAAIGFQPIHEFWDGNHVARHRDARAACAHATSTLGMVRCFEDRAENSDVRIDAVRSRQFAAATTAGRAAINRDDAAWLAHRSPVCDAGYAQAQGTLVQVLVARCLAAESAARLDAVESRPVPTAHLQATDNVDPTATQYATAGDGTRVGAIDTQGDQTGGVVIAWVVIAGYHGFSVVPRDFRYVDGSFVDRGVVQGGAAGHHVQAGHEYVFDVDYSRLAKDPHRTKGTGRYEYAAGGHVVGSWK